MASKKRGASRASKAQNIPPPLTGAVASKKRGASKASKAQSGAPPSTVAVASKKRGASNASKAQSIAPPVPIRRWVSPEDLRAAFGAARQEIVASTEKLDLIAEKASEAVNACLKEVREPTATDHEKTAKNLQTLGSNLAAALEMFFEEFPEARRAMPGQSDEELATEFQDTLLRTSSPSIRALANGVSPTGRSDDGVPVLFETLRSIYALQGAANLVGRWFEEAAKRERAVLEPRERADIRRRLPQQVAARLMDAFINLGGSQVGLSRTCPLAEEPNSPSGPLFRYLEVLFSRLRLQLRADYYTRDLATRPAWAPKPETVATWIKTYQSEKRAARAP